MRMSTIDKNLNPAMLAAVGMNYVGSSAVSRAGSYAVVELPPSDAPIGTIVAFGGTEEMLRKQKRFGWYECNGDAMPRDAYPLYYAAISTTHGGDAHKAYLPDLRGIGLSSAMGTRVYGYREVLSPARNLTASAAPSSFSGFEPESLEWHTYQAKGHSGFSARSAIGREDHASLSSIGRSGGLLASSTVGSLEGLPAAVQVYWIIKVK